MVKEYSKAVLEVGSGGRGVFRFFRGGYQMFVSDALVVKSIGAGKYRLVPSYDRERGCWFKVVDEGKSGVGYVGEVIVDFGLPSEDFAFGNTGEGEGDTGVEVGNGSGNGSASGNVNGNGSGNVVGGYELGYVVLGYGYVLGGAEILNRSRAVSELWQAMLLLPYCEFEVV